MSMIILRDLTNDSQLSDCSAEADKIFGGIFDISVSITNITENIKTVSNTVAIGGNSTSQVIMQTANG